MKFTRLSATGTGIGSETTVSLSPNWWSPQLSLVWTGAGFGIADVRRGVRITHGAEDTRGEPDFRYLAATLPDCEARIWPDVGHWPALEVPDRVGEAIVERLGRS